MKNRLIAFIAARCRGERLIALITIHSPGDHLLAFIAARSPEEHLLAPVAARSPEERLHAFITARLLDVRLRTLIAARSLDERLHAFIVARLLDVRLHAFVAAHSLDERLRGFIAARLLDVRLHALVAAHSLEERLHIFIAPRSRQGRLLVFVTAHSREDRFLALVAALSLAVGLVHGLLVSALLAATSVTPHNAVLHLERPAQDDFIVAVAEAYAGDHDLPLARDRLARLHSVNLAARVENLARDYAIQYDLVASQLAGLAVALGSRNTLLVALSVVAQPTATTQNSANTSELTPPPAQWLGASILPLPEEGPVNPTPAQWLGAPLLPLPEEGPVNPTPAQQWLGAPLLPLPEGGSAAAATPMPQLSEAAQQVQAAANVAQPPAATKKPATTKAQLPAPTSVLASNANPDASNQAGSGSSPVVLRVSLSLPDYVGAPSFSIPLNAPPSRCTPASQLPAVVDRTMALCPNQVYPPFRVKGNNITIYGDPGGTARIYARGRGFGITVNGSNITITGVHIEAETNPADLKTWLCLYDNCGFKTGPVRGGIGYGGGILLDNTTNATVVSSTVSKGTIGVAVMRGSNNKIAKSNLSNLNGWGALLLFTKGNALVGNTLNHVTRDCVGPDGDYIQAGCESAGIAAIQAEANLFVDNHCEHSSNCIYASGDGGYGSNNNKFFNNYCAASPNNCFEVTFSSGNRFDYNVATSDLNTGDKCIYPFWIGGSTVEFGPHNTWNCKFSAEQAFKDSKAGANVSTDMRGF